MNGRSGMGGVLSHCNAMVIAVMYLYIYNVNVCGSAHRCGSVVNGVLQREWILCVYLIKMCAYLYPWLCKYSHMIGTPTLTLYWDMQTDNMQLPHSRLLMLYKKVNNMMAVMLSFLYCPCSLYRSGHVLEVGVV